jgi:dTDP-4-amino-4,6-dideoxygalactose transaminase
MSGRSFAGSFTQQEPIPEEAIAAAVAVLRSGRLHRYNIAAGETPEVALLERDYAAWQGSRYCLAVASGGQAMQIALRAAGVRPGDHVLSNAFTLAPVPSAISAIGAVPVLVEITEDLVVDLDDLEAKVHSSGAQVLLLSNMRGHLCDMNRLMRVADAAGLLVIEDCAHTMGATWRGQRSGSFGLAGCFSTQTYKHLNAGEGGLLTANDAAFMARAVILSGSYMLYARHGAAPPPEVFAEIRLDMPNLSARMDNLRAAILRPQLARIEDAIARWNERYDRVAAGLAEDSTFVLPRRLAEERYVGSSIQFRIPGIAPHEAAPFLAATTAHGVELKWFGDPEPVGFTSTHRTWRYVPEQDLPRTDRILAGLFDMRLPLTFTLEDCDLIVAIIRDCAASLGLRSAA